MALQPRADACVCDPAHGLPRGVSEAPDHRACHQGDDDDDHLDAGVDGHGDRRSAVRDSKRGDVVLVIIIMTIVQMTEALANAMAARRRGATALVRALSH